jgi:hypothetical protein
MAIADLIAQAFAQSRVRYPALVKSWIAISAHVGSRLPDSLLMVSLQREGNLDLLLRALEDEVLSSLKASKQDDSMADHYLNMFSTYWIGGMYEIFRLLRQRKLADSTPLFEQLFLALEQVRMPLEKHEIAKDWKLRDSLPLQRHPLQHNSTDVYEYDSQDEKKAHIMPTAVSRVNGSIMWLVIDANVRTSCWVERRWLSDKMLELWNEAISNSVSEATAP